MFKNSQAHTTINKHQKLLHWHSLFLLLTMHISPCFTIQELNNIHEIQGLKHWPQGDVIEPLLCTVLLKQLFSLTENDCQFCSYPSNDLCHGSESYFTEYSCLNTSPIHCNHCLQSHCLCFFLLCRTRVWGGMLSLLAVCSPILNIRHDPICFTNSPAG